MFEKGKQVKIFIYLKYAILICTIFLLLSLALLVVSLSAWWDFSSGSLVLAILAGILVVISLLALWVSWRTATISDQGIMIKMPFKVLCRIKWSEIKSVYVKFAPALTSARGGNLDMKWIYIVIGDSILEKEHPHNRNKKKTSHQILYRPKHAAILAEYFTEFRPDLDITDLLRKPKPKTKDR